MCGGCGCWCVGCGFWVVRLGDKMEVVFVFWVVLSCWCLFFVWFCSFLLFFLWVVFLCFGLVSFWGVCVLVVGF